jgi:hypothetical protein
LYLIDDFITDEQIAALLSAAREQMKESWTSPLVRGVTGAAGQYPIADENNDHKLTLQEMHNTLKLNFDVDMPVEQILQMYVSDIMVKPRILSQVSRFVNTN